MDRIRTKPGFSLIQILIALFIISVALVPVSYLYLTSNKNVMKGGAVLEATIIASSLLDQVRSQYFILSNLNQKIRVPDDAYPQFTIMDHFRDKYNAWAEIDISNYDPGQYKNDFRRIMITVFWEENQQQRKLQFITFDTDLSDARMYNF